MGGGSCWRGRTRRSERSAGRSGHLRPQPARLARRPHGWQIAQAGLRGDRSDGRLQHVEQLCSWPECLETEGPLHAGRFHFKGPSRAYGYASVGLTRRLSLNGGLTKRANAFFKGGDHRVYVDSAPHFVANAALTLAAWHGWSGSLRMRAINHYRLDGDDPALSAAATIALGVMLYMLGRLNAASDAWTAASAALTAANTAVLNARSIVISKCAEGVNAPCLKVPNPCGG